MAASIFLLAMAVVTLIIGWVAGSNGWLFASIASSVAAGILLVVSYLQERRVRVQPGGEAISEGALAASQPSWGISTPTTIEREEIEEEGEEELAEEEEVMPAAVPRPRPRAKRKAPVKAKAPARTRAKPKGRAAPRPKARAAPKPKTKAKAKVTKAVAKPKTKAKPTRPKAKSAAKPKSPGRKRTS